MKISELSMRTGKLNSRNSQQFVDKNSSTWYTDGKIIGQIDNYYLRKFDNIYSLWDKEQYVASALLDNDEVNLLHVNSKYRNQKVLSKLLCNFKTRQGKKKLIVNQYHSDDLYDVFKNGGLSRFKKYWQNTSGEIAPFDINTIDKYYSYSGPTGWKLVLENNGNFSDMPHYTDGKNWITEDYSWQIE
jgi:hypothetical protein